MLSSDILTVKQLPTSESTAHLLHSFNTLHKELANTSVQLFSDFEIEDNFITFQVTLLPFQSIIIPESLLNFLHFDQESSVIEIQREHNKIR